MDDRSVDQRSATMAAIKSRGTKLEKGFVSELRRCGIRGLEFHPKGVYGNPDIVKRNKKLAIFVDSCFWHGCPHHCRMPNTNKIYWERKIAGNRKRDKWVIKKLSQRGWIVKRVWEHSIKNPTKLRWWVTRITNLEGS